MEKQTEERKDIGQTGAASIRPRLKVQIAGTEPFFGPGVRSAASAYPVRRLRA